ncbi:MAG: outer membrane protein [Parvibaculaceae bacterium]
MLRSLTCGCAALLMASSAYAADIEAPAPYDWNGFYLGLHAGYLWGDVDIEEEGEVAASGGDIDGFVGGALAGFNVQFDPLVLGLEADIGWTDVDGDGVAPPPEPDYSYELNWNAHVRARAGFAFDNALIFVAGGLAIADLDIDQYNTNQIGGDYYGWSIGGGIDYAFTDALIGRIEYLHDEFGDKDYEEDEEDYTADLDTDTVRAALIYKFMP